MRHQVWQHFRDRDLEVPVLVNWLDELQLLLYLGNDLSKQIFVAGCIDPNEFAFLDKVLQPGMTFVDVGANEGIYALFASRRVTNSGIVYAFEPSAREFERLVQNLRLNSARNVRALRLALADQVGEAELAVAGPEHSGHNTIGVFAYDVVRLRSEVVSTQTLDDVVREHGIVRLDVVKLDVEGAELRVLNGGREALRRYRPLILFEVTDSALRGQGTSAPELCAAVSGLGYRLFIYGDETGLPVEAEQGQFSDNMLAVPVERQLPETVFRLTPPHRRGDAPE
jgi:FkbM family methyltransferase